MNLTYLQSFYTTVKCNSISKAAKELHLTQPGLSMQLQNLEQEINAKILIRSNKGVSLTAEGSVLFEYAENMLSLKDNILKDIQNLNNKNKSIKLCSCKNLGEHILPCSLYTFKEIYPDIDISMEVSNSTTVIEKIKNHDINIGIIQEMEIPDDIDAIPILKDRLVLTGGPQSTINNMTLEELKNIPLVSREIDSANQVLLENRLNNYNIKLNDLNLVLSLNSPEAIKSSLRSNMGFAFLPETTIEHEIRTSKLKKILIKDFDIPFNYYFVHRKNYQFTNHEKKLLSFLKSKNRCFCY